ncbi:hypothetical protein ILUMI_23490 [Ignelater luminosus]|uniref:Uncharacterized protein n=1 Tax=Ignelater luminosus TaxID=2038154 RepID=A0A8K0G1U7_IGNLU|nr:hypothetical protein ILUMI_23490 [Ignelater luminosus]
MELALYDYKIMMISAYAPTEDAVETLKDSFEEDLTKLLDEIPGEIRDRAAYIKSSKVVKKEVAEAKNQTWENKCEKINRLLRSTKAKQVWTKLRALRVGAQNEMEDRQLREEDIEDREGWRKGTEKR